MRKHMPRTSTMQQLMNLKYNKEGIRKKCEYTFNKLMMDMERYMYNIKEKQRKEYAEVVWLPILLPSVLCFLFLVAVRVQLKSLSSSGLSSAEVVPVAIPIERETPRSDLLLKEALRTAANVPKDNYTMEQRDRTCVRCAQSCAMDMQTDMYIARCHGNRALLFSYHPKAKG